MPRAFPGGFVEAAAGALEERAPRERVAVAPQPGTRDADHDVALAHRDRQHLLALHDSDREADEVELADVHHSRVLRHLTAEQRAPGFATTARNARHDLVD